jgi:hypothetical protein
MHVKRLRDELGDVQNDENVDRSNLIRPKVDKN